MSNAGSMANQHLNAILDSADPSIYEVTTKADGPAGSLPLTDEMLTDWPSGDLFGLTQNAGMGWTATEVARDPYLILSTQGGLRGPDGQPIALGYHTGHWEIGILVKEAAEELRRLDVVPFAGMVSDPCDGRTQGTAGMMDSLPYRNDAAIVFRRLIRSLPRRKGVLGIATCDKGLPAMMMALAGSKQLAGVLVPGGVTLPPREGEDAGKIQSIGARYAHGELTLPEAAELGCRACASPGGGCQFLGTAATSQVVAEALGITLPHAALAPSGQPIWRDMARRSARALVALVAQGLTLADVLTRCRHPERHGRACRVRRLDQLAAPYPGHRLRRRLEPPDGRRLARGQRQGSPAGQRSAQRPLLSPDRAGLSRRRRAGSHAPLARANLLDLSVVTVTGEPLERVLEWWETSERRKRLRERLLEQDGVDPDDVIMSPAAGPGAGSDEHRHIPARQPGADRFGDQEHGDRPERR